MNAHLVTDADGIPLAVIDPDQIRSRATLLAFDMAAACHDQTALEEISTRYLTGLGSEASGCLAAVALHILAHHVLHPVLDVTDDSTRPGT